MRESENGWLGEGRGGEVTAVRSPHAEARFPGVRREPLGGGIWPRGSEKARGWLIYAIWELVRHSLSRVAGADSSIGGGLPLPGSQTPSSVDLAPQVRHLVSLNTSRIPVSPRLRENSSGEGHEGSPGPSPCTLSPLNTHPAILSWPCQMLI